MAIIPFLNELIANRHLLTHPFYQAWSEGQLSKKTLQTYAAQYYHQVKSFPRFISRVHTQCDNIQVRKALLSNLVDEELHGTDHPALWMQFAEGLGVAQQDVLRETPLNETQTMVDTYYHLAERDWRDGLCALYAYEYQVPEISTSKIAGLKQFYHIQDEKTLAFFTAHQQYDVEHANQVATLIEEYVDKKRAQNAIQEACDALWLFLDGMSRVNVYTCARMA